MPVLPNPRHEKFAQALASGTCASAAYGEAGHKPNRHQRGRVSTITGARLVVLYPIRNMAVNIAVIVRGGEKPSYIESDFCLNACAISRLHAFFAAQSVQRKHDASCERSRGSLPGLAAIPHWPDRSPCPARTNTSTVIATAVETGIAEIVVAAAPPIARGSKIRIGWRAAVWRLARISRIYWNTVAGRLMIAGRKP